MIPEDLKKEIKKLIGSMQKKVGLGTTKKVSEKIFEDYQKKTGKFTKIIVKKDFSNILCESIKAEKKYFEQKKKIIISSWYPHLTESSSKYPKLKRIMARTRKSINLKNSKDDIIHQVTKNFGIIQGAIETSMNNSAKSRAGKCLENHLAVLFKILEFKFEQQKKVDSKEKFDFLFPSKEQVKRNPHGAILGESQTTLKDRFRLSLGKGDALKSGSKYIFTATGLNIVTLTDHTDLTENKIKEIIEKKWNLVVFKEVKMNKKFKKFPLISFEEFVKNHYKSKSLLWKN